MTIGEKILTLRKRQGLSQEQLADVLDVSRQAVSKWESGQSVPELDKLPRLARQFAVSIDYLVDDAQTEPSSQKKAYGSRADAGFWRAFSLGLLAIGLAVAVFGWMAAQTLAPVCVGLGLQILGVVFYEGFAIAVADPHAMPAMRRAYYRVAVWLLAPVPACMVAYGAFRLLPFAYAAFWPPAAALALYGLAGGLVWYRLGRRANAKQ